MLKKCFALSHNGVRNYKFKKGSIKVEKYALK